MTHAEKTPPASDVVAELRRLIEALDRRVPHLERADEATIARDAADLRARALALARRLETESKK
jgi:hypothetical protein